MDGSLHSSLKCALPGRTSAGTAVGPAPEDHPSVGSLSSGLLFATSGM